MAPPWLHGKIPKADADGESGLARRAHGRHVGLPRTTALVKLTRMHVLIAGRSMPMILTSCSQARRWRGRQVPGPDAQGPGEVCPLDRLQGPGHPPHVRARRQRRLPNQREGVWKHSL